MPSNTNSSTPEDAQLSVTSELKKLNPHSNPGAPWRAKAIGHPPELRAGLARVVQVRRDQEIETAAGRVGNLSGSPHTVLKLRLGGTTVDVGPDLLGRGLGAIENKQ
ncbi:hypothetical protein [Bradyrhizobium sp. AZCC 2230]|uniref:hypothetical protein n=1 Tax=Bradyrhizobium sp. AZCC 2230 TaxID=3117021 RepID=UPI002FF36FD6